MVYGDVFLLLGHMLCVLVCGFDTFVYLNYVAGVVTFIT